MTDYPPQERDFFRGDSEQYPGRRGGRGDVPDRRDQDQAGPGQARPGQWGRLRQLYYAQNFWTRRMAATSSTFVSFTP